MARTTTEIISALKGSIRGVDPSADVEAGPIYDVFVEPISGQLAKVETRQDRTNRLASSDFSAAATVEELERMASTVGAGPSQGKVASGSVFIGTHSQPRAGSTISVPPGSLVGTLDGKLVYITTNPTTLTINGTFPQAHFNPVDRTYELEVPAQAIAPGGEYNVPPYRIRQLLSTLPGASFVINRERFQGGADPAGTDDLIARAETSLVGQEIASPGGVASGVLKAFSENAKSLSVVTSADPLLFHREVDRPGSDYYYYGEERVVFNQELIAAGGEVSVLLEKQPVLAIKKVLVNGGSVGYTLVTDTSLATGGSSQATDTVVLDAALGPADVLAIQGEYDSLASQIADLFTGDEGLFGTDIVARRSRRVYPRIVLQARASSGFNEFTLRTSLQAAIKLFFETGEHGATYSHQVFKETITRTVVGIAAKGLVVSTFQRSSLYYSDVEPIELDPREVAEIDTDLIAISIT